MRPSPTRFGNHTFTFLNFALCVLGAVLFASATFSAAPSEPLGQSPTPPTGASFIERFDRLSRARWYTSDGWANGDWQACTFSRENVSIDSEGLALALKSQMLKDRNYTCSEVKSNDYYGYGTYEVRMQAASASGTVSAFFIYAGGAGLNQPADEIDFEILGRDITKVQLNYYVDAKPQGAESVNVGSDSSKQMNDYAFEWLRDSIRWYINGRLVREVLRKPDTPFPTHISKIDMMLWNSTTLLDWLGPFAAASTPQSARFAWVAFTKAGEGCRFPESLLCREKH